MTYDSRVRPHQIRPADDTGALVDPGVYGVEVVNGGPFGKRVSGLTPVVGLPSGGATGETLAKASGTDYDAEFVDGSVPVVLLAAGSDATDVPAGTPVGSLVAIKA